MAPPQPSFGGQREWGQSSVMYVAKTPKGTLISTAELASGKGSGSDDEQPKHHAGLGQWRATSIAGNDLLSSCLYTAGICAGYAGKMAPLSLLLVAVMLYFFRFVYAEVVTALALNGGSYTALANTTSKRVAALAACLSLISYIATAVVSAESAVNYVQLLWPAINTQAGTLIGTVSVMALFAFLNILGMSESANVATGMFVLHFFALSVLMIWSFIWACQNKWQLFTENLSSPYPSGATWSSALYFGYSAALLGITGFETAANYVEELKDGQTYVRVLRNMWWSVSIFNPCLGLLSMAVMPMSEMIQPQYSSNLLGPVAKIVGGDAFQFFICIDGFIVLCGSVLTAYVGVGGLFERLALDRCLPELLLATNKWRGTHHWIILGFFAISSSLFIALNGDVDMLGSVYNIAFLSVMTCFAMSCVILKWKRPLLPRMVVTSPGCVAAALFCVVAGLIGNIVRQPEILAWFALYFGCAVTIVFAMFNRTAILKMTLNVFTACLSGKRGRKAQENQLKMLIASHAAKEQMLATAREKMERGRLQSVVALNISVPSLNGDAPSSVTAGPDEDDHNDVETALLSAGGYDALGEDAAADGGTDSTSSSAQLDFSLPEFQGCKGRFLKSLAKKLEEVNSKPYVFFAKGPDFETLNKAILYVRANEQTHRLIVVHVVDDSEAVQNLKERGVSVHTPIVTPRGQHTTNVTDLPSPTEAPGSFEAALTSDLPPLPASAVLLREQVLLMDSIYPKLRMDFMAVRGTVFGPPVIRWLSRYLSIGTNCMFIAMPDAAFPHQFASLGGVRVITRASGAEHRAEREEHVVQLIQSAGKALASAAAAGPGVDADGGS